MGCAVSDRAADGLCRAAFCQHPYGTGGASGRGDEWHVSGGAGAAWNEVRLAPPIKAAAYWTALYGTYINWLVTTLAAVFGTAVLSPITGAGHHGLPWQETLVGIAFPTVGIAIVACSVLVLWGLRSKAAA